MDPLRMCITFWEREKSLAIILMCEYTNTNVCGSLERTLKLNVLNEIIFKLVIF